MSARIAVAACLLSGALAARAQAPEAAQFEGEKLAYPVAYREWVFLSAGYDMSYSPFSKPGHHLFSNVFVDPAAWRYFQAHGTWPQHAVLVLELRGAKTHGSINVAGSYQEEDVTGIEVHVKDSTRSRDGWGFYSFDAHRAASTMIPEAAECYECHAKHAAVDRTFVQFYPTLLPLAKGRGTLSSAYLAEAGH